MLAESRRERLPLVVRRQRNIVAYCGFRCANCIVRRATIHSIRRLGIAFNLPGMTALHSDSTKK